MKASSLLSVPAILVLFTSCLTPAYRDSDFFREDRSGPYARTDPYAEQTKRRAGLDSSGAASKGTLRTRAPRLPPTRR